MLGPNRAGPNVTAQPCRPNRAGPTVTAQLRVIEFLQDQFCEYDLSGLNGDNLFDVLYAASSGVLAGDGVLIPDVTAEAFKAMLAFIYADDLSGLNGDNLFDVLYAAKKYQINLLVDACADFSVSNVQNSFKAFERARFFGEEALRWADEQCAQNGKECTGENRREMLGPALYKIRFPLMSRDEFSKSIAHQKGRLTLKIGKFSDFSPGGESATERYSDAVNIRGFSFKMLANMCTMRADKNKKCLGFFIECNKNEANWCCTCSATLQIVVQKKCKYYSPFIKQFKDNNFRAEINKLGAMEFISIEDQFCEYDLSGLNGDNLFDVLYAASSGVLAGDGVLIPDVTAEAFKAMLAFIYADDLSGLNGDNLFDVLYAAKKYQINLLVDACADFSVSNVQNSFKAFERARFFGEEAFACRCLDHINFNNDLIIQQFLKVNNQLFPSKGAADAENRKIFRFFSPGGESATERYSDAVNIRGFSFKMLANMCTMRADKNKKCLGFFIECNKNEANWCCTCSATLQIVVQKKCKYYSPFIKQFKDNNFRAEINKLGAMEFISIEDQFCEYDLSGLNGDNLFDVLYAASSGVLAGDGVLIPDVTAEAFKAMLAFIYADDLSGLNGDNLFDVLYAAKKYQINLLVDACADFSVSNVQNSFKAFERARFFGEEALRWADEQCAQNGKECTGENRREMLGPALYKIRFPLMSRDEFSKSIAHQKGRLTLKIGKFSDFSPGGESATERYSDAVNIRGFSFKMLANMCTMRADKNKKCLGFFIECNKNEANWCCTCSATLQIVVQKKCKYYSPFIKQFKDNNFRAEINKLGAMEFISIEQLMNPANE
ncbi:hypothetical protein niasHT_011632 [Heterodera trifolii]|uniref:BTB domain-containing protein n=1 Tax=Heterodera trifolii TaxID=157864 RepID=A0ABD2LH00_9BILA